MKFRSSTSELYLILFVLSVVEGDGIFGVEVKFVDIGRNIRGEGDLLGHY